MTFTPLTKYVLMKQLITWACGWSLYWMSQVNVWVKGNRPVRFLPTITIRWCDSFVNKSPRVKSSCNYLVFCHSAWDYCGKNNVRARNAVRINWIFILEILFCKHYHEKSYILTFWKCHGPNLICLLFIVIQSYVISIRFKSANTS